MTFRVSRNPVREMKGCLNNFWHTNKERPKHNRACIFVVFDSHDNFDFAGVSDFFGVSCFYYGNMPVYLNEVKKWCYLSDVK